MLCSPRVPGGSALAVVCVAVLLSATTVHAQDTGTVSGTIFDSSGKVVPGATVMLTNEATADARTTVSGESGAFAFRAVPPGTYTVRIELSRPRCRPGLRRHGSTYEPVSPLTPHVA